MSDRALIGQRLKEFQAAEIKRILGACTQCGKCYEGCPVAQYSKAPSQDAKTTVPRALAVLRGERAQPRQIGAKEDRDYFDRIRAFAKLQLTDDELKDWT